MSFLKIFQSQTNTNTSSPCFELTLEIEFPPRAIVNISRYQEETENILQKTLIWEKNPENDLLIKAVIEFPCDSLEIKDYKNALSDLYDYLGKHDFYHYYCKYNTGFRIHNIMEPYGYPIRVYEIKSILKTNRCTLKITRKKVTEDGTQIICKPQNYPLIRKSILGKKILLLNFKGRTLFTSTVTQENVPDISANIEDYIATYIIRGISMEDLEGGPLKKSTEKKAVTDIAIPYE